MAPTLPATRLLTDPGYILFAPIGTTEPTNTVVGSVFTDAWNASFVVVGGTESGSEFTYSTKIEPITIAELFDPIKYSTTERSGSFAFNMSSWTLKNLNLALNGGTFSVVSGTGTTQLGKYEPPTPGSEVRIMLGWESLDATARIVMRQCIQGGDVKSTFAKAPSNATIPVEFQFEKPAAAQPFSVYSAGTSRYDGT